MLISGKKLAEARERRGMTQEELGKRLGGIIKQNISLWENGKKDIPLKYYDTLKRLFGSAIEDLDLPDETLNILRRVPEALQESYVEALNEYANEHEEEINYHNIDGKELAEAIEEVANLALQSVGGSARMHLVASNDKMIDFSEVDGIRSELDRIWPRLSLTGRSKILTFAAELLEKSGAGASEDDLEKDRAKHA